MKLNAARLAAKVSDSLTRDFNENHDESGRFTAAGASDEFSPGRAAKESSQRAASLSGDARKSSEKAGLIGMDMVRAHIASGMAEAGSHKGAAEKHGEMVLLHGDRLAHASTEEERRRELKAVVAHSTAEQANQHADQAEQTRSLNGYPKVY